MAEYIRNGYKMLERISERRSAAPPASCSTTFQKLNASSTAAIKPPSGRLCDCAVNLCDVAQDEEEDQQDERYRRRTMTKEACRSITTAQIMEDEIKTLEAALWPCLSSRQEADRAAGPDRSHRRRKPRGDQEKVLIFTEYRQTQRYLVDELEKKYGKGCVVVIHGGMKLDGSRRSNEI